MIIPVYLNIHVTSILDDSTTLTVNEFELDEVESFESGVTPFLNWSQDSFQYTNTGNVTTVTINGHFDIGITIDGLDITYSDMWIAIVTFDNQTGEAIEMRVIKN